MLRGTEYKCPFCGGQFRKLLPSGIDAQELKEKKVVGGGYRLNAVCPLCHSLDRERLVYLFLRDITNVFSENLKMLHVAPEKNLQRVLTASPNIDYLSADLNSPSTMVKMDITNISLGDNLFDVIICNHVLEHVPDDREAMSELYRVLKPGGWAICQVPISLSLSKTYEDSTVVEPEKREKLFGKSDHVRIYAKDYKDRLENAGFTVEVYNFTKEFGKSTSHKYGLIKDENLYVCSKAENRKL